MPNSKLSSLIPNISLKTSHRNPLTALGLSGTGVTDKANALLSKYKQYTAVDLSNLSPTGQTSRVNIVEEAAKQRLRELAQLERSTSAETGTASHTVPTASKEQNAQPTQANVSTGGYTPGTRIANTASYNNDAAKGQCVWYVRGRAKEKLGVDTGAIGNANQMYSNAKTSARVSASKENIKPNMIVSYNKGTSSAGQSYGHVIYIEDVVGDTVYYTEGGSGYYKNGTDGVVKTATRQGIIDGVNTSGSRMGSEVLGFIDLSKY